MKNVLLIGLGLFGKTVAEELYKLGHQVMAVDKNEAYVNDVLDYVTTVKSVTAPIKNFLNL